MDEFFAQHCSKHCSYNNPPPSEVIGVAALAHPDLVFERVAFAAVPDEVRLTRGPLKPRRPETDSRTETFSLGHFSPRRLARWGAAPPRAAARGGGLRVAIITEPTAL